MPGEIAAKSEARLTLQSRLEDLALLWPWVQSLAADYAIPADSQFAIDLCLEEALSNVIRHGYRGEPGRPITVDFTSGAGFVVFTVQDQAPSFDPLAVSQARKELPPASIDDFPIGGLGISFMRKFAGGLHYERLSNGNRLTMRFEVLR